MASATTAMMPGKATIILERIPASPKSHGAATRRDLARSRSDRQGVNHDAGEKLFDRASRRSTDRQRSKAGISGAAGTSSAASSRFTFFESVSILPRPAKIGRKTASPRARAVWPALLPRGEDCMANCSRMARAGRRRYAATPDSHQPVMRAHGNVMTPQIAVPSHCPYTFSLVRTVAAARCAASGNSSK